jgi:hypothetical protein
VQWKSSGPRNTKSFPQRLQEEEEKTVRFFVIQEYSVFLYRVAGKGMP